MTSPRRQRGWLAARALRAREQLAADRRLDVEDLARSLGARVVRGDLDGAMARLLVQGRRAVIRLSTRVVQAEAQRFSVAHEIGHLVMQHSTPPPMAMAAGALMRPIDRNVEIEANAFAAELLMPEAEIRARLASATLGLTLARAIAVDMNVSLVAAALRCVELSAEPGAVALVQSDRIAWIATGGGFRTRYRRGMRVDLASRVALAAGDRAMPYASVVVPARAWRVRDVGDSSFVHEEAAHVPEQVALLALVTASDPAVRAS